MSKKAWVFTRKLGHEQQYIQIIATPTGKHLTTNTTENLGVLALEYATKFPTRQAARDALLPIKRGCSICATTGWSQSHITKINV